MLFAVLGAAQRGKCSTKGRGIYAALIRVDLDDREAFRVILLQGFWLEVGDGRLFSSA